MSLSESSLNSSISFTSPNASLDTADVDGRLSTSITVIQPLPMIPPARFIPIRPLGIGTFATVYAALDNVTGSLIAMKKIYAGTFDIEPVLKTSVEREIDILTQVKEHRNIVTIYGYGVDENFRYIYMDLVAGGSLFSLVQSIGPLEELVIRRILRQIVNVLIHLHSIGIIHRDIKTKNILLATDGTIKLADFGAACQKPDSMNEMMNVSANFSYTPLYVAPEVLHNKYDAKVDIWALGCTLVEMASGLELWTEKQFQNAFECFKTIAETNEIPKIPSTLSADGIDFALKCFDRNPVTRPSAIDLLCHPFLTNEISSS